MGVCARERERERDEDDISVESIEDQLNNIISKSDDV